MPLTASRRTATDYDLTTGETSFDRQFAVGSATMTSGLLKLAYFKAKKTETITQLRMFTTGTAAGATPTLCRAGVYSVAANGDLTLAASIANDTTLFAGQNTSYTRSFSGGNLSKLAGQWYAVGIIVVTGAAAPTLLGQALGNSTIGVEMFVAPPLCAAFSSQTDLTSPITFASLSSQVSRAYTAALP